MVIILGEYRSMSSLGPSGQEAGMITEFQEAITVGN